MASTETVIHTREEDVFKARVRRLHVTETDWSFVTVALKVGDIETNWYVNHDQERNFAAALRELADSFEALINQEQTTQ